MKVALAIPTYNAGNEFRTVLTLINQQRNLVDAIKIIDSTSVDNTVAIAKEFTKQLGGNIYAKKSVSKLKIIIEL